MASKYRQADSEFAEGFHVALSDTGLISARQDPLWRPVASLATPYGTVEGDASALVENGLAGMTTLLVAEREGSGPGNERNILKWLVAIKEGHKLELRKDGRQVTVPYDRVAVLLAFGRSEKWPKSDFNKTVAFCQLLAEMVNESVIGKQGLLKIYVQSEDRVVDDWRTSAHSHGNRIAAKLQ